MQKKFHVIISALGLIPHLKTQGVQQGDDTVSNDCVMAGSSCFCIENSSVWMLGNDDEWHEI